MKKVLHLLIVAGVLPLTGCINLSFGGRRPPPPQPAPQIVVPSIPTAPMGPSESATIAEIDAAARLSFDAGRKESLSQVAERPGLSPVVQVHLVNVAYRALSFDSAKVELLRRLIANPAFSDAARQAIVTQLNHLSFDSNRQEILRQLNQRVSNS